MHLHDPPKQGQDTRAGGLVPEAKQLGSLFMTATSMHVEKD
jgi:hypothetical protein